MVRAVLKSYRKNILREMKDNLSRMVSLFGIVALGVMMLTGLMSFAPSMRIAGQKYYVQQNVFDLRVLSTLGLSEEDIAAIDVGQNHGTIGIRAHFGARSHREHGFPGLVCPYVILGFVAVFVGYDIT